MENLFWVFIDEQELPVARYTHVYSNPAPIHNHDFFELLVPLSGTAYHVFKGQTHTLTPGEVIMMRPGDEHEIKTLPETPHFHRDIYVSPEKMKRICDFLSPNTYEKIMSASEPISFQIDMKKLQVLDDQLKQLDSNAPSFIDAESFHSCIVFEILSFYIDHQINHYSSLPEWLRAFLVKLNSPEIMVAPIEQIIALTNYSRGYVCAEFKKYIGKSLGKYITENKINYSTSLLANSDLAISQIATMLGYDSQNSFTRNFQEQFSITPAAWRKKARLQSPPQNKRSRLN